jgi:hypothetical protein
MFIFSSGPKLPEGMPMEEVRGNFQRFGQWMEEMKSTGRYVVSDKLTEEGGKVVSSKSGQISVTDGPYIEAKEVIGGYVTIRAADYDEAVAIARSCPYLAFGNVTIRKTDPMGCGDE